MTRLTSAYQKLSLQELLQKALPGDLAHRMMLPSGRQLHPVDKRTEIIPSSVLIILFPEEGNLNTCLIRRPISMKNHGGQIAFPGGRCEPADIDLMATALRETAEEIGVEVDRSAILGALSPLYIQVSRFMLHPFIAWIDHRPTFKINPHEVDQLLVVPLKELLDQRTIQSGKVRTSSGEIEVPGYRMDTHFIWGATAMILAEFAELYGKILEPEEENR